MGVVPAGDMNNAKRCVCVCVFCVCVCVCVCVRMMKIRKKREAIQEANLLNIYIYIFT